MDRKKIYAIVGGIVAVLLALALVKHACDRAGYWPRRQDVRVYVGTVAWPDGETRKCSAMPREDGTMFFLGCVEGSENFLDGQDISVTFWGRTQRPDRFKALHSFRMEGWHWMCKPDDRRLTCYAVN